MSVPLVDLKAQHADLMPDLLAAFSELAGAGKLILGDAVATFERELAAFCGTKHAVGVSSGTDALLIAMMALDIGAGDEVITSPMTFFCTAGCIARLGAKPVFVDIDPKTFNLDAEQLEGAITDRTRAIVPVHLYGQAADMDAIMAIARRHDLRVIEDAAQALGARWRDQPVGSIGDVGCLSFYPTKNLPALGDAGAVVTNDDAIAEQLRLLRVHGSTDGVTYTEVGGNFRIDAIQAACLSVKLDHLQGWNMARRSHARRYNALLEPMMVASPYVRPEAYHVYSVYTIRVFGGQRDALQKHLLSEGIGCRVYYQTPLHLQPALAELGYHPESFIHAEAAAAEVLSLPMYPELTRPQQDEVVSAIGDFFEVN